MTKPEPIVLLTRPSLGSEQFAQALRQSCQVPVSVIISPVLKIETTGRSPDLTGYEGVVLTSSHAVDAVNGSHDLGGLIAYCVGAATARKAKEAGFAAIDAGGNAEALIDRVMRDRPEGPLLHLRGVHSQGDIAARLSEDGIKTSELVVYDQVEMELGPDASAAIHTQRPLIVPVFSTRSAGLLSAYFADNVSGPHVVAISEPVAGSWKARASRVTIAKRPDARSMVEAVVEAIQIDSPC